jgi:hypothetical protein
MAQSLFLVSSFDYTGPFPLISLLISFAFRPREGGGDVDDGGVMMQGSEEGSVMRFLCLLDVMRYSTRFLAMMSLGLLVDIIRTVVDPQVFNLKPKSHPTSVIHHR